MSNSKIDDNINSPYNALKMFDILAEMGAHFHEVTLADGTTLENVILKECFESFIVLASNVKREGEDTANVTIYFLLPEDICSAMRPMTFDEIYAAFGDDDEDTNVDDTAPKEADHGESA